MHRTLWMIAFLSLPAITWGQTSGPGPMNGQTEQAYQVMLLQFGSALGGTIVFTQGNTAATAGGSGGTAQAAASTIGGSGNVAAIPNGATVNSFPAVAGYVANAYQGNSANSGTNGNGAATNSTGGAAASGANGTGTASNANRTGFSGFGNSVNGSANGSTNANLGVTGATMTSGQLIATLNSQALVGQWQAFEMGGYAVWFAQANGTSSMQAWGWATPNTIVGSASLQMQTNQTFFGGLFGSLFPQTYFLVGEAVDVGLGAQLQ